MTALAYLGPEGTFTHQAALDLLPAGAELRPLETAEAVVAAVEAGDVEAGVIAIENSLEGTVTRNIDQLLHTTSRCVIAGERIIPVSFALYRAPGDDAPLTHVASHVFGLGQCAGSLAELGVETEATTSTVAACRDLAADPRPGHAALAPVGSGEPYGLRAVRTPMEDQPASTRFVLLRTGCPGPSGHDRTAIAVTPQRDEPGSLVRLLQEFSLRGVNLAVIKSRPTREELGEYVFYLECEGHLADPLVGEAVIALLRASNEVRFLGSFPADAARTVVPREDSRDAAVARYEDLLRLIEDR